MRKIGKKEYDEVRLIATKMAAEAVNYVLDKDATTLRQALDDDIHLTAIVVVVALQSDHEDGGAVPVLSITCHDNHQSPKNVGAKLIETGMEMVTRTSGSTMLVEVVQKGDTMMMSDPFTDKEKR